MSSLAIFLQQSLWMSWTSNIRRVLLFAAVGWALAANSLTAQSPPAGNYGAEAEDLQHVAEFVDWPATGNADAAHTINFCVLGQDPFGAALDQSILGHSIDNRRAVIVRGKRLEDMGECDVLFISSSKAKRLPEIFKRLRGSSVLTISEISDFAASGGMIQFVRQSGHIGFVINVDAAGRADLKIRAPLLALAQIVHDAPGKRGG